MVYGENLHVVYKNIQWNTWPHKNWTKCNKTVTFKKKTKKPKTLESSKTIWFGHDPGQWFISLYPDSPFHIAVHFCNKSQM